MTPAIHWVRSNWDFSTGISDVQEHLIQLRQILTGRFAEGELRTLCFDLGVGGPKSIVELLESAVKTSERYVGQK